MTLFVNLLRYFTISTLVSFSLQDSIPGCDCPGTPCSNVLIDDGELYPSCLPFYMMVEFSRNSEPFTLDDKPVCDSILTPNNKEKEHPYLSMIGGNGTCDDAMKHIESTCYEPAPIFLSSARLFYGLCSSFSSIYTPGLNIAEKCSKDKGLEIYIAQDADKEDTDFFDEVCSEKVEIAPALTSSDWIEPEEGQRYMCKDFTHSSGDQNFILVRSLGKDVCPIVNEEENSGSSALSKDNQMMIIAFVSILVHLTNAIL